ncbi:MAG: transcription antitermination factor NusB [Pseudomonadota bacterium]
MSENGSAKGKSGKGGFAARKAALALLNGVTKDHLQISDLTRADGPLYGLAPADKARAQRLALTTLRHLSRADALVASYVDRMPPPPALNVLRLAITELLVEGEAPHGVVDSSVSVMRAQGQSRKMAGLANAVLRKVASNGVDAWDALPVPTLPKWLRRRIVHIYDEETVGRIEASHLAGAPLDLTPKYPADAEKLAEALGGALLPTGSIRLTDAGQVSALDGFENGHWWVQDAGAALAVKLLAPQVGENILDLCAAPGGKTMQLAAAGANVTALDISRPRMTRIRENLDRTGLDATLVAADVLHWEAPRLFDAILLDAPCSATGTIRRHPDLPFAKNGKDLHALFELQSAMIDCAIAALKPGGRLVYCTCSLLTEEGERQAKTAMERHDLEEIAPDLAALGLPEDWRHSAGGLRLRPDFWSDCGGIDGFFMISLRKPG